MTFRILVLSGSTRHEHEIVCKPFATKLSLVPLRIELVRASEPFGCKFSKGWFMRITRRSIVSYIDLFSASLNLRRVENLTDSPPTKKFKRFFCLLVLLKGGEN